MILHGIKANFMWPNQSNLPFHMLHEHFVVVVTTRHHCQRFPTFFEVDFGNVKPKLGF
jgi:hypothetical protein